MLLLLRLEPIYYFYFINILVIALVYYVNVYLYEFITTLKL